MAGNKRIAAIIIFTLTAIGATGAGAYYFLIHSGWTLALTQTDAAAGAQSQAAAPAELDAVADAWAKPATEALSDDDSIAAEPSAPARTDVVLPARAEEPAAAQPVVEDPYALATIPAAAAPVTPAASGDEQELYAVPGASLESPQQLPTDNAARYDEQLPNAEPEESATPSYESAAVARGQEPTDDATGIEVSDVAAEPTPAVRELSHVTDDAESQVPIALPAGEPEPSTAAQRARNAFRDSPAAAPEDGYGATAAVPRTASSASNAGKALVNPFAARSARSSQPAGDDGLIEPLPALPADVGAPLPNEQGADAKYGAPAAAASAQPSGDSFGAATQGGAQDRSIGSLRSQENTNQLNAPSSNLLESGQGGASNLDGTGRPGERALEGPQKPALLVQKFAPAEIQVGKPAKFVVQIRNVGVQAADEVVIRDQVPQGTRLLSTSPSAQANGNELVWQLGKLSAGEERSLEMQLMPVSEGEIGSVATVSYSAQASVKTRCTMPQLAIRMSAPEKVMIGQEQRVKIELRNPGSGDATGVMLFENVPENVKHAAGPALEFEIGTLRAGESRELELVLLAEKAGKVVNILTAKAEGNLQVQQQVEFEVIAPALDVVVSGPERRYLERPATYEVSVENPGTAPAHDVQIITKLPKGMRFVRANNMGEYDAATHAVYWSLAELPEGESGKVELVTMPVETGPQTLEVESRAGQGLTDQAKQQIIVEGLAAIMFEVRDVEDPIEVGGETGYEIRVVNQGTKAATNVQVAVHLPPGMQIVSAEGETQHGTRGGALTFEPLPQLLPKADTVYRVRVQGLQAGDQRITVEVNTDDLAQPIRREESTRVFGDE
jgi:uncharacterized repeat protein (TIGR01451 family)